MQPASIMGYMMRLHGLARLLKEKISGWAAVSQQSENTFVPDSSMKCT
jgi:hypothetical protein